MGRGNASQRKKVTDKQKEQDFFQTTSELIYALLDKKYNDNNDVVYGKILDPCCGNKKIGNAIRKSNLDYYELTEYDKFIGDNKKDFLEETNKYDFIIMNPPYSYKNEFIRKAKETAINSFILLPVSVESYISFCEEFLDSDYYRGKIHCYPKLWLNEEGIYKQGGLTAYAWYHFTHEIIKDVNKYQIFVDIRQYRKKENIII